MVDFKQLQSQTPEERKEQREKFEADYKREEDTYTEFLTDATACAKLTEWERSFIADLASSHSRGFIGRFDELSYRQQEVCKRLRKKVYQIG